jgi:endoglucanase
VCAGILTSACIPKKKSFLSAETTYTTPFFTDPSSKAQQAIGQGGANAAAFQKIALGTVSHWLAWGDAVQIRAEVTSYMQKAKAAKRLPVLVVYNIPDRDCGSYSKGGAADYRNYQNWIAAIADAIGSDVAWVIWEPDRILHDECSHQWSQYLIAVSRLKQNANTRVYIDAGHSNWRTPEATADRLKKAGIDKADGFSLNVSNYRLDAELIAFGQKVKERVGKNFVIDSSRNGQGPLGDEWCNPKGRGLGQFPVMNTGVPGLDAYLWIKNPGESDGDCMRSEPKAGDWFDAIASELVRNARNAEPPAGSHMGEIANLPTGSGQSTTGIECRGNQIYVDGWPDIICDKKCSMKNAKATCEGDLGHWPKGPGQLGPDNIFRECRDKQIYVDKWPDVICTKACFMQGYKAVCEDGLQTLPNGPGQTGPDGIFRECRQAQIFVDRKPDVICTKGCYMQGYQAKCYNDEDNSRQTPTSTTPNPTAGPGGAVDGRKLAELINCFANYLPNAAYRADNSRTAGCATESIFWCRTDKGTGDRFCKFDGTNKLKDSNDNPSCYFNCQMETCNSWDAPDTPQRQQCVNNLSK